jgi:hypothetical protein
MGFAMRNTRIWVGAALLVSGAVDGTLARAQPGPVSVTATITSATLNLSTMQANAGTIVFQIANHSGIPRTFTIGGKTSAVIPANKSATFTVVLAGGTYLALSYGPALTHGLSTELTVNATCLHPTRTTVTVRMRPGPIALSRSTVPCGTVTFRVTNVGRTLVQVFAIYQPNNDGVQLGHSPRLSPGRSASLTVQFRTRGRAFYSDASGNPDQAEQYNEYGYLTVV